MLSRASVILDDYGAGEAAKKLDDEIPRRPNRHATEIQDDPPPAETTPAATTTPAASTMAPAAPTTAAAPTP